jgi:hypothetical protein
MRLAVVAPAIFLAATPAQANVVLRVAHAGSTCVFGPYRSTGVGSVLVGGPDKRGPAGNEVRDIQRIFFVVPATEKEPLRIGFAGWLMSSFDGRLAYNPASLAGALPQTAIGGDVMEVTPAPADRLPLQAWLHALTQRMHDAPTAELAPLLTAKSISTALSPCFSTPWDGKSLK